jgi:hypothetical protein
MMQDFEGQFCPVPQEQQPLQEYQALKEAWLLGWGGLPLTDYGRKLAWFGLLVTGLTSPIAAASFPPSKYLLPFLLANFLGVAIALGLLLVRIFLGWFYIGDRLQSPQVIYEESGWYDGQVWDKPAAILARDRLIFQYQVIPVLIRLKNTLGVLALLTFLAIVGLAWLAPPLIPNG